MSDIFLLMRKKMDVFGDEPDVWEPVSYTLNLQTAIRWREGSHRDEHRDFRYLPESKGLW